MSTDVVNTDNVVVNGSNRTINYGMELLQCDPKSSTAISSKQIGLQLVILGMSEIQAARIANLAIAAYELERKIWSPEYLSTLDSKKLLSTYEQVNKALQEALQYIQTTQGMEWNNVDAKLKKLLDEDPNKQVVIDPKDEEAQRKVSATAKELLVLATGQGS